jgi:FtsZ-binding cell division protein ZapB
MAVSIKQKFDMRTQAFVARLNASRQSIRFTGILNAQEADIQESIEEIWCYVRQHRNSLDSTYAMSIIRTSINLTLEKSMEVAAGLLAEIERLKEKNAALIKANKELKKVIHENETNAERNEEHGHIAEPESERPTSHRDATEA